MEELISYVDGLVYEELARANVINKDKFIDMHQGWAVTLEEVHEVNREIALMDNNIDYVWNNVMRDNPEAALEYMKEVKKRAILTACESIQVGAMAEKFIESFK